MMNNNGPILHFLIVDDHDSARKMLRQMVSNHPTWKVVGEATNGIEAIAKLEQEPDVVLMDIVMPAMDGLEAVQRIKRIRPNTIVILTTAYRDQEFRARSLEAGADGFVLKDDLMIDALQRILSTRRRGER